MKRGLAGEPKINPVYPSVPASLGPVVFYVHLDSTSVPLKYVHHAHPAKPRPALRCHPTPALLCAAHLGAVEEENQVEEVGERVSGKLVVVLHLGPTARHAPAKPVPRLDVGALDQSLFRKKIYIC